jgi:SpoVK/Ycf46/Vps4 family AAA+-type ATPase
MDRRVCSCFFLRHTFIHNLLSSIFLYSGTGKSHLMSKLANKIGIAMLAPPLASGNLERSLVGQSEAVISSSCRRAKRLPHLICCLSIDQIDSLAPRRDEKSSEGKVSKISVLLSVLEGAENVPNLMFFSATNLLHRMDEAFLRRMSGKFFIGRPSSESRK